MQYVHTTFGSTTKGKERKGDLRDSLNHHWKELAHKQVGD